MSKKMTSIVLLIILIIISYNWFPHHHEINNIYDEIYWSVMQDGTCDTMTDYKNMEGEIRGPGRDFYPNSEDEINYYIKYYDCEPVIIRIDYEDDALEVCCSDDSSVSGVELDYYCIYDIAKMQLKQLFYVVDKSRGVIGETCSRAEAEILLKKRNTMVAKERDRLMACVDHFIEQWITSNEGKTKFSLDDLGEYTALPVVLGEDIGTGR